MINQNLVNLSTVDVELCEIRNDSVDSAKSEILPSMFNFVIVELNNLEELINDSAYLERKFRFTSFEMPITYTQSKGFVIVDDYGVRHPLIKMNPQEIFNTTFMTSDMWKGKHNFKIESQFNSFCNYLETFKANYLAYMKDVQASQQRILDKIGCE